MCRLSGRAVFQKAEVVFFLLRGGRITSQKLERSVDRQNSSRQDDHHIFDSTTAEFLGEFVIMTLTCTDDTSSVGLKSKSKPNLIEGSVSKRARRKKSRKSSSRMTQIEKEFRVIQSLIPPFTHKQKLTEVRDKIQKSVCHITIILLVIF